MSSLAAHADSGVILDSLFSRRQLLKGLGWVLSLATLVTALFSIDPPDHRQCEEPGSGAMVSQSVTPATAFCIPSSITHEEYRRVDPARPDAGQLRVIYENGRFSVLR